MNAFVRFGGPHACVLVLAFSALAGCRTTALPVVARSPAAWSAPAQPAARPGELSALAIEDEAPREEEQETYHWPRLSLSLGAQLVGVINTVLRVDSETLGEGTEVDLEDDFNLDDSFFLGRIDAGWQMSRRNSLDLSAFQLSRQGTGVIDRDIQIGDVVFPVDSSVENESDILVLKLAYRYAFLDRPRGHMGASLGLHTMDWNTEWRAGALSLKEDFDFLVPLPVIGLFGAYALTPRWYLNASSEFFGLEYEEFDGFLNNTRLSLEHRTFSHVGFGLGLDYFLIDASVANESGSLEASAEYDYLGLVVYMRVY